MTKALEQAFKEASKLPPSEQDALADAILGEIKAEEKWEKGSAAVHPRISQQHLEAAYEQMAQDEKREADALAWSEGTVGDVADETR